MKSILTFSIAALAAVLLVAGCETDPNSSPGAPEIRPMAGKPQSVVDPAIAFGAPVTRAGKTYANLCVIDSDGTDLSFVYKAPNQEATIEFPSWSPGGGSIAFKEFDFTLGPRIKVLDVSVSQGKVIGSNTRSVFEAGRYGVLMVHGVSWSSLSSTNKIAYNLHEGAYVNKIMVVPASGGTSTVLYEHRDTNRYYLSVTWSPDDSKIAFIDHAPGISGALRPDTIRVIDASTGELLESIGVGSTPTIEWSRSGVNLLAFSSDFGSGFKLYYVTPTTGSTPWTNNVSGYYPTWSPNNSSLVMANGSTLQKTVYGTSTTTTFFTWGSGQSNWKR